MLSINNLATADQAASYFEKDSYYARRGGYLAAEWWGKGAEDLGLAGKEVTPEKFKEVLLGKIDGEQIAGGKGGERRPATDLTFSAPKSVSLAALVFKDERIFEAHDKAVAKSLDYLQEVGAQIRVTKAGEATFVPTGNLLVATFKHDTSRPVDGQPDPQLHTHAVVINATKADHGWRALSNEKLYEYKMLGGAIYRAELALELERLGYAVERTHADGRFEIKGPSREQVETFSQRRSLVEEELAARKEQLAARGLVGAVAAKEVVLRTREKKLDLSPEALMAQWETRAHEAKLTLEQFQRGQKAPGQEDRKDAAREGIERAAEHLGERQSVFHRRDVLTYATQNVVGRGGFDEVKVALGDAARRGDLLPTSEQEYTTHAAMTVEKETLAMARRGKGASEPIGKDDEARGVARGYGLTSEQEKALCHVATSRDRVLLVEGYAGVGKTRALGALAELAEEKNWQLRACAPSAAAAEVLEKESGIKANTLALHLLEQRQAQGPAAGNGERTLWIVDEGSMVSARQAHELLRQAERTHARVLILGDPQQLPSVEAGQPFEQLGDRVLSPAIMREIQRQRDPELRAAVMATIEHHPEEAVRILDPHIREQADHEKRLDAIAADYVKLSPEDRKETLVLTGSNADRESLNTRIRVGLERDGALAGPKLEADILENKRLTKDQMRDPLNFEEGDVIRFGRAYKDLGVAKGDYLTVARTESDTNTVHLRREDGREVAWQPQRQGNVEAYAVDRRELQAGDVIRWTRNEHELGRRNGRYAEVERVDGKHHTATIRMGDKTQDLDLGREKHWEHGYAVTVHAAQGATSDRVLVNLDTRQPLLIGEQTSYVALSRAREEVRVYTDDKELLPDALKNIQAQKSAITERERYLKELDARSRAHEPRQEAQARQPDQATGRDEHGREAADKDRRPPEGGERQERPRPPTSAPRSNDLTAQAVHRQLEAMKAERYDVGIRDEKSGRMINRYDQTAAQVEREVGWLKHMNAQGNHIYIRPAGDEHRLSLVDDLDKNGVARMKADGLEPAAVIETSPGKHQAWVKHERDLDPEERRAAAKDLAERYGGDPSSTDARHFGRLAGYTNVKPEYRDERGYHPFSVLREDGGKVASRDREYLKQLGERVEREKVPAPEGARARGQEPEKVRPIEEYHRDPRFGGDLHRADMAWARHAAEHGKDRDDISRGVLEGRDLSKKGGADRQREYAERTADKAIAQAERDHGARRAQHDEPAPSHDAAERRGPAQGAHDLRGDEATPREEGDQGRGAGDVEHQDRGSDHDRDDRDHDRDYDLER